MTNTAKFTLSVICAFMFLNLSVANNLVFNEVMSSNQVFLLDSDGDSPDWFEIYNTSTAPLSLGSYRVNDKRDTTNAWSFPDYLLDADQYLTVFASGKDIKDYPSYWQTIIKSGDEWSYLVPTSEPSADWKNISFNDATWSTGASGFGYGDDDDNTILEGVQSVYIRKQFTIADASKVKEGFLHIDYDDAFVAYLNGVEIARANITSNGSPAYNAQADNSNHEPRMITGGVPDQFIINDISSVIVDGFNVLSIQVHNAGTNSSDLSAIPFLSLGYSSPVSGTIAPFITIPQAKFHTDFSIKSNGETLYLFDNNILVDSVVVPEMPSNISYGRDQAGDFAWRFFAEPTPEAVNNTQAYSSLAGKVMFSFPGGVYQTEIVVQLSSENIDDKIYYTTDGSEPTINDLLFSNEITINNTTLLRASVINEQGMPGYVYTQSYFFNVMHDMPIISLVTDEANFFDNTTGIYVNGSVRHPLSGKDCDGGQNFWQGWERPVHVSMINTDGSLAFEQDAGVKVFGGCSRTFAQKSLSLRFRKSYDKNGLKYKLFDDLDIDKYYSFNLRNSGNDWCVTMMRDALLTNMFPKQIDKLAYRPSVVYINGEYWGIHNMRERISDDFIEAHHDVDASSVNMMEFHVNMLLNEVAGDGQSYLDLLDFMGANDLVYPANYEYVTTQIDVENFALYQVGNICLRNTDWPGNNVKFWSSAQSDAKWRWIVYDLDFGFKNINHNTLTFALSPDGTGWPNPAASTYLLRQLNQNTDFQHLFINAFADVLNTLWVSDYINPLIDNISAGISNEIEAHMIRWGGNYSNWQNEVNALYSYAANRPAVVRDFVQDYYDISGSYYLKLKVNDATQGSIKLNTIQPEIYPWIGTYFNDIPVELEAIPAKGYRFIGWQDASTSTDAKISITANKNTIVTALFEKDDDYKDIVIINEVFYTNVKDSTPEDWIELYNLGDLPIDLSGWIVKDDDDTHQFIIPTGTTIAADSFVVVCRDTLLFNNYYSGVNSSVGNMSFGFGNKSDCVRLYNYQEVLVDSVGYINAQPTDTTAFGIQRFIQADTVAWLVTKGGGTPNYSNKKDIIDGLENSLMASFNFSVSPNPFNDKLTVSFTQKQKGTVTISLYNQSGVLLSILSNSTYTSGKYQVALPINDDLPQGVYMLEMTTDLGRSYTKVVKL